MRRRERLSVGLVELINRFTPQLNSDTLRSKRDVRDYSQFEYKRASSNVRVFNGHFSVQARDILDVGSGLGGGERFYAEQGARSIMALDLNLSRLRAGRQYADAALGTDQRVKIRFLAGDVRRIALPDKCLDVIVSTNTFEHIFGVEEALRECARILRPGGRLLISFPPYYSPWGAHLVNWIRFPWCQVLFSEKTLVAAARRIEARTRLNDWMPESIRLDLTGHDEVPHLNRMRVRDFEALLPRVPLRIVHSSCKAIGWRSGGWLSRIGRLLVRSARLREYVTSQAAYVLERPRE